MTTETKHAQFGKNLREVREILGLSQTAPAQKSRVTPAAISQIETGSREPTYSTIVKILKVIPVKLEKLAEGDL